MYKIALLSLVAVATAAPQNYGPPPARSSGGGGGGGGRRGGASISGGRGAAGAGFGAGGFSGASAGPATAFTGAAGAGGYTGGAGGGFAGGASSGGFRGSSGGASFGGGPVVAIVRDDRNGPVDGVYDFAYESADGINRYEQGSPSAPNGAVVSQGGWTFTFPDGTPAQFNFIADENGYRVDSPLLPTPPPMPAHALEQIAKAERERAAGIVHDGQYDPSLYGGGSASSGGSSGGFRGQAQSGGFSGQAGGFAGQSGGFAGQAGGFGGQRVSGGGQRGGGQGGSYGYN